MTVANLGSISVTNASTTVAITCANAAVAGTPVVVFVFDANNSITSASVTDTAGNTYAQVISASPIANFFVAVYCSVIDHALTTSDSVTYHCGNRTCAKTMSVVSAFGYSGIDAATSNSAVNFSAAYSVTGAHTVGQANELYFGFVVSNGATVNAASGWTANPPVAPTANFYPAYKVNTGTTALTFNGTVSNQSWAAVIVSLQPNLTTNFASFAITETYDIVSVPINDANRASMAITEARDSVHIVFFNLAALDVTEARDKVVMREPALSAEQAAVRVSLAGRKSSPDLEGDL